MGHDIFLHCTGCQCLTPHTTHTSIARAGSSMHRQAACAFCGAITAEAPLQAPAGVSPISPAPSRSRILLVDDNPEDVGLTVDALEHGASPAQVSVTRDGAEALDYLHCRGDYAARDDGDPTFILLDLKMPRVDGSELLAHIKTDDKLKWLPVVILTSSCLESDLRKCYALGANAYVVKPVEFQAFNDVIRDTGLFWSGINKQPSLV